MLNLIVGPKQISPKIIRHTKKIVKYLKNKKVEYSVCFSNEIKDISTNVEELLSFGENEFVVIGNDLVVHEFINAIPDLNKIKFGIVPSGNDDDFASYLGLSENPIQAIKDILEKHVEEVDYLILNNFKVLNNITIGIIAEVMEIYLEYKMKNQISFKYALLKYGSKFNGINLNINSKNNTLSENIFDLSICNGGQMLGKQLNPLSNVKDGLFNLNYVLTNKETNKKYLSLFSSEKHIYDENTKQLWLDSVKISNEENKIKVYADGKLFNLNNVTVTLKEKGLKLYKAKK